MIGPWAIPAPSAGTSGWSVKVDNSRGKITDYFNIFGISSTYNDTNTTDPTIWLVNVHTATTISGNNADHTCSVKYRGTKRQARIYGLSTIWNRSSYANW